MFYTSYITSFYHPLSVAKRAITLSPPQLVGDGTPVEGIAVQALPKSEVGGRGDTVKHNLNHSIRRMKWLHQG